MDVSPGRHRGFRPMYPKERCAAGNLVALPLSLVSDCANSGSTGPFGSNLPVPKRGREGLESALPRRERFAIDPKRAVYIDDVAANVDAARPFGIHTVHFKTPSALRAEPAELGLLPARSTLPSR
jgi:hypothetical protein